MEKWYANFAFFYAIIAMIFGVFYREFTKLNHFTGQTNLSILHTHYFLLGMFFFLILMLVEKLFAFSDKTIKKFILVYQIGLNITGLAFFIRGLIQVQEIINLEKGIDASISGIAGIGHSLMGISLIFILRKIKKSID